ncbi:hypothetical protein E2320_009948 [Naja naja]|nr:hypothetical protein E2320_009948 [Naja naja]
MNLKRGPHKQVYKPLAKTSLPLLSARCKTLQANLVSSLASSVGGLLSHPPTLLMRGCGGVREKGPNKGGACLEELFRFVSFDSDSDFSRSLSGADDSEALFRTFPEDQAFCTSWQKNFKSGRSNASK